MSGCETTSAGRYSIAEGKNSLPFISPAIIVKRLLQELVVKIHKTADAFSMDLLPALKFAYVK